MFLGLLYGIFFLTEAMTFKSSEYNSDMRHDMNWDFKTFKCYVSFCTDKKSSLTESDENAIICIQNKNII